MMLHVMPSIQVLWEGLALNIIHCEVETRDGYVMESASSSSVPEQLLDQHTWGGNPSHWIALRELGKLAMLSNTLPEAGEVDAIHEIWDFLFSLMK